MNLKVTTGTGTEERRIKVSEEVRVKGQVIQAGELLSMRVDPGQPDDPCTALLVFGNGTGRYLTFSRGDRISIGSESWPVDAIVELELLAPPMPAEVAPPYEPGSWRVHFSDGSEMLLDRVSHFTDLSTYEWHEGVAVPPREPAEVAP